MKRTNEDDVSSCLLDVMFHANRRCGAVRMERQEVKEKETEEKDKDKDKDNKKETD